MSDTLTTITHLINSPPGQLTAGVVLAGIVWKFFERVESVLTEHTKLEIAVWLVGVRIGQKVAPWPQTFARVFDRVFGERHLSWACFLRAVSASYLLAGLLIVFDSVLLRRENAYGITNILLSTLIAGALPDYVALLTTRICLAGMRRTSRVWLWLFLVLADAWVTVLIAVLSVGTYEYVGNWFIQWREYGDWFPPPFLDATLYFMIGGLLQGPLSFPVYVFHQLNLHGAHYAFFPTLFTSIWLWLYVAAGILLIAARRFDIGFDWFNRKFDIEKKPLSSIGLVAGALVAVVYWTAVIVSRVLG
jgi:hypothetical protein